MPADEGVTLNEVTSGLLFWGSPFHREAVRLGGLLYLEVILMADSYITKNYAAHGGNEWVVGGKLTFLPGATVEGAEGLFDLPVTPKDCPVIADSTAATVAALREDFNALLKALRDAGFITAPADTGGGNA